MIPYVKIATRNLAAHRTRTFLMGGAITIIAILLVTLTSLTAGIEYALLNTGTSLMSGHINIAGFYKISQTTATPTVTRYQSLLELARKDVPEARAIVHRQKAYGKIISDETSITVPVWGIDFESEKGIIGHLPLAPQLAYVFDFKGAPDEVEAAADFSRISRPGSIAIFATHAKKLKVRVGDSVTLSMPTFRNVNNTRDVRIAAVLRDLGMMSSFTIFANAQDIREIYQMAADATGQIMVFLKDPALVPEVEARLRKSITAQGLRVMDKDPQPYWMKFDRVAGESWTGQKIDVTTWQDETSFVKWILDILKTLTGIFIFILLAIVVLGLVNTLWMAIRERTSEVGTLRAIGLQSRQVVGMFFLESVILTACATGLGLILGSALAVTLNAGAIPIRSDAFQMFLMASELTLKVRGTDLLFGFGLIVVSLSLGSLLPAYRAGKLKPLTAVNQGE